ncbi:MAG: hypothetical protein V1913_15800 [Fibrobacterota bacterium]
MQVNTLEKEWTWIGYNDTTMALMDESCNIFAKIITVRKRDLNNRFEVRAYGKYEGRFPSLERQFLFRDDAERAALEIAWHINETNVASHADNKY